MPELTVIIPTLNERDNVKPLVDALGCVLEGISWEALFVDDDSADGTAAAVRELAQNDARVRVLHRVGRRGLSSACIEGAMASSAPYLVVMDADMQHDESILPEMLRVLREDDLDIVVGSRFVDGGGTGEMSGLRVRASHLATSMSRWSLRHSLSDPMSGFFAVRRSFLDEAVHGTSAIGFKILLDLFASAPGEVRFKEIPYVMRARTRGKSKLGTGVVWEYLLLLIDKRLGKVIPLGVLRALPFALAGAAAHLLLMRGLRAGGMSVFGAQAGATFVTLGICQLPRKAERDAGFAHRVPARVVAFVVAVVLSGIIAAYLYGRGVTWYACGLLGAMSGWTCANLGRS